MLVCGAGITGIQASLDLAESGFKVYLLDSSPAIGGRMAQLDKTFPTGDCAMCILSPKLVECARNKNIEIVTLADVQGISGEPGNFKVKIRQNPRYVDLDKCNACGDCTEACPVSLPNEFDRRLGTRKAIFRPYPQAIPNVFGISKAAGRAPCKASCPAGVNAQGYVALIGAGKFAEAYELIRERCPLPAACGRVCQHPCQDKCNRSEIDEAVNVRDLKRFAADYIHANPDAVSARQAGGGETRCQGGHRGRRSGRSDGRLRPGSAGLRSHSVRTAAAAWAACCATEFPAIACPMTFWTRRSSTFSTWAWRREPARRWPIRRVCWAPGSMPCSPPRARGSAARWAFPARTRRAFGRDSISCAR